MKNQYVGEDCLKRGGLGQFADLKLRGGLDKKGGEGVDTPMYTVYSILISNIVNKPTSSICFGKLFENASLNWSKICLLPCLATIRYYRLDTILRSFQ